MGLTPIKKPHEKNPSWSRRDDPPWPEDLQQTILNKLLYMVGKDITAAGPHDWFVATAFAVRDHIVRFLDRLHASNL